CPRDVVDNHASARAERARTGARPSAAAPGGGVEKPRILLVQPTTIHLDGTPHKTRWRLIMGLMIPLLAGLPPDDFDVTLCDERLGPGRNDHHHRRLATRVPAWR